MRVGYYARSGGLVGIFFFIFFNMKVYCVFSLESPHRGDSNNYTQYTIFNIKRKIDLNYLNSAAMGFFLGTQALVRNSHGKRAISVRAIEVLLYITSEIQISLEFFKSGNKIYAFKMNRRKTDKNSHANKQTVSVFISEASYEKYKRHKNYTGETYCFSHSCLSACPSVRLSVRPSQIVSVQ